MSEKSKLRSHKKNEKFTYAWILETVAENRMWTEERKIHGRVQEL